MNSFQAVLKPFKTELKERNDEVNKHLAEILGMKPDYRKQGYTYLRRLILHKPCETIRYGDTLDCRRYVIFEYRSGRISVWLDYKCLGYRNTLNGAINLLNRRIH